MQQHFVQSEASPLLISPVIFAETDAIRTVSDSVPVHPENKRSSFDDFKHPKKRKPASESQPEEPAGKSPDTDHQIDEYA